MFAAKRGGPFDLANFRRREWQPAIEASGVRRPARIYDMRSTFASNSLAAGISVFELARVMGTSVVMIERHYGTLIEGAGADIARRLSGLRGRAGCARRAAFGPLASQAGRAAPEQQPRKPPVCRGYAGCPREDSNLRPAA
jgi:hypothetical protein